jgi:hypothetical protein
MGRDHTVVRTRRDSFTGVAPRFFSRRTQNAYGSIARFQIGQVRELQTWAQASPGSAGMATCGENLNPPTNSMKRYLLSALGLALTLTSCEVAPYGTGVTSVGVGVGYYDTLPVGWGNPYYYYGNRYYYGGLWEPGRFFYNGRYYSGRYSHRGQYYYGGHYHPHHTSGYHRSTTTYPHHSGTYEHRSGTYPYRRRWH